MFRGGRSGLEASGAARGGTQMSDKPWRFRMGSWLTKPGGDEADRRRKNLSPEARAIYDAGQLAVMKAQVVLYFGERAMEGITDLDDERRHLAGNDQARNMFLAEFEATTAQQLKRIQRQLFWEPGQP